MEQSVLSLQSEVFLRYLSSPRNFQRVYPHRSSAVYGFEGRESYGEAEQGLLLLFMVGEDFFSRDQRALAAKLAADSTLVSSMFQLCSLVRFAIESGDEMMTVMDSDDEDFIETYASGVWQVMRFFSRTILEEMGIEIKPPDQSYSEVFVAQCFEIRKNG